MKFTKMQGIGNDYVYINCFEESVEEPARLARLISDRHFGIGSDGLILIRPSEIADCEMEMYNMDGSLAGMCGNGIRCVAKFVYDHGIVDRTSISIATGSGIRYLDLSIVNGKVSQVRVNMGEPILEPEKIPALFPPESASQDGVILDAPLEAGGRIWAVTPVSMGNPHCVTFVEDTDSLDLPVIGPVFENHPAFPERVNTEFIQVSDRNVLRMRVWERGSGETMACGTGACAAAVAAILTGRADPDESVRVCLKGGDLHIRWDRRTNLVYMTGPAVEVFHGEIDLAGLTP